MIAKPTTQQILLECCRELTEVVLPAIPDETVKVSVLMLDLVLRGAAVRAAHEIAWMTEEIDELQAYARDASDTETELDARAGPADRSLHLDDVVEAYRRASEAFSRAMEAAVAAGDDTLTRRAAALMERRVERETEVMSGWSPVGR